mmetsp:Transcript_49005/g.142713  ORF Transcript_49005/g.142713 Transcript_49005/m.142713 type:complete len:151 (-) Transcript_49005:135-587(-)
MWIDEEPLLDDARWVDSPELWTRIRTPSPEALRGVVTLQDVPAPNVDGLLAHLQEHFVKAVRGHDATANFASPASALCDDPIGDRRVLHLFSPTGGHTASAGSAGHPLFCAEPCKFVCTRRGCKDGDTCARCHLCTWHKSPSPQKGSRQI